MELSPPPPDTDIARPVRCVVSRRHPANRHQNLRDFIAEGRRSRRNRQPESVDDEDDISVVVAPGPSRVGRLLAVSAPPEGESGVQVADGHEEAAHAVGPRRNIGREFDEEDRDRGGGGRGGGGGQRNETVGGNEEDQRGDNIDSGGSRPSFRSSPSSSPPRREAFHENAAGGEAVGAMEGVHPGLATYDSQRAAAGMDGGGRAGQEEYARMLDLMQKVKP